MIAFYRIYQRILFSFCCFNGCFFYLFMEVCIKSFHIGQLINLKKKKTRENEHQQLISFSTILFILWNCTIFIKCRSWILFCCLLFFVLNFVFLFLLIYFWNVGRKAVQCYENDECCPACRSCHNLFLYVLIYVLIFTHVLPSVYFLVFVCIYFFFSQLWCYFVILCV